MGTFLKIQHKSLTTSLPFLNVHPTLLDGLAAFMIGKNAK
jgi:hypothetical protein